jgi:AcrR family transcriptional regulator
MTSDMRLRLLEGTYECIVRQGIASTSLEDAARAAGVSRATLYRYFPGGRDELIGEVIAWQTLVFFEGLADAVAEATDIEAVLVEGILAAHRGIESHAVLQRLLRTEPGLLVPQLTVESPWLVALLKGFFEERLRELPLRAGLDLDEAADYVARMSLSFIASPGRWDLSDREQVLELVRSELMAGLTPR